MEIRPTSYAEVAYLSTIRLLVEKKTGPEVASAFIIEDEKRNGFVVTARHCTEGASSVTLHFYSGNGGPDLGSPVTYETRDPNFWCFHDDPHVDIAVGALNEVAEFFEQHQQPFFAASIATKDFVPKWSQAPPSPFDGFLRPRALDEVLLVGYPNDYRDNQTSLPLLRRGITATPLWLDHEGRAVFLVDTAASHGTSGGPVFFVEEKQQSGKTMYADTGRVLLLGVFSEVLPPKATTAPPGIVVRPPNLGAAYRADAILQVLEKLTNTQIDVRSA